MNNFRLQIWLPLTLAGLGLGTAGIAAPPATASTLPATTATSPTADDITIVDTGDAYLPGYRITIGPNGELASASFARNGGPTIRRNDQMTPTNHQRFLADLTKATPVNTLPTGTAAPAQRRRRRTPAPAVRPLPGAQIFIIYQKKTSPNLRMASSAAGKTLYQDIKQIMQVLRMPIPDVP